MGLVDCLKRIFRGRKISIKVAPHRADTNTGGVFSVNLILREDSRRAITTEGRSLRLWELNDSANRLLATVEADQRIEFAATDCCSDEWVAFASAGTSLSSPSFLEFRCWKTMVVRRTVPMPGGLVWPQSMAVSRDGRLIAVASHEETLMLYDRNSGELLAKSERQNPLITGTAFSPDSRLLAAAFTDQGGGDVLVFDVSQGKLRVLHNSLPRDGRSQYDLADSIVRSAFSHDSSYLALHETYGWSEDQRQQGTVALYRMPSARLEWTRELASDEISQELQRLGSVACCFDTQPEFSANGQVLYVGTVDGNVIAISTTNGTQLARLQLPGNEFVRHVVVDNVAGKLWSTKGVEPVSTAQLPDQALRPIAEI
jgi:WD40 repeat protein